ncbi:MAG: isoleucine--tRNA ligase [Tissierellia bacterium]|nr:isoleucine--tRNA ligase [Tissierellia bacterium]
MELFQPLSNATVKEREYKISEYWKHVDLLKRSIETRADKPSYVFYEGPPTANGKPGIHHVMARTLKDLTCRYQTMKGHKVIRKAGWDTHGLPVEIEVEKKLGLKNKSDIEHYGIEKFNAQCRESVFQYEKIWRDMTERMAYLIDLDHPYVTLENEYIESVWWILDQMYKDGLIYEGHKILPYCTRCGTGLASHEVAQGYEETKTETVIVAFKATDEDAYFLAWTTTPWTLPSNVALAVHPEVDYVKVLFKGDKYYLAKELAPSILGEEYEVLETIKGKDLEYRQYEQLLPFVNVEEKAFFIGCGDYVTTSDGTGIVHTAPAFGEDDYNLALKYGYPVVNPVSEDGRFVTTPWEGKFVMDADADIIQWLRAEGKLFKKEKMLHNYPHCWRCHTPLLYYAKPSWYIEMTKLKDKLIENNNSVEWYPDYVGEKRFGNWLENLNDWAISRSRYWGTPFPIWRCDDCNHITSIGSRKELAEKAIENIDETIELHRPYVDDVHIKCEKCGAQMTREKDVIDVWFDSGAMPFAQYHYPFENMETWEDQFPADFIDEGIDQTRGWFYSLLAISTYVKGVSPFKRVLVNDLVVDKDGKKMSKSRGNTVDPFELFDRFGADVLRWYLLYVSPPWVPTKFDEDGLREVESKFFRSLRNVYNFFSLYANSDGIDPRSYDVEVEERDEMDRWILSRYNSLLKRVNDDFEKFELTRIVHEIQDFVIEDLSNWYIRRGRRRFWKEEHDTDKKSVYLTTYEILEGICRLIAPFVPFISEELYLSLKESESVHLEDYPTSNEALIDVKLEERMELVRNLTTLGRAARENAKIKVRQPLSEVVIDGRYEATIGDLTELLKEELNVKSVDFEPNLSEYMNFELKPNFPVAGPIFGKNIKAFGAKLQEVDAKSLIEQLEGGEMVKMDFGSGEVEIKREFIDVRIEAKEGFNVNMENNLFVILDTTLTEELIAEGYVREFISKVQQLRKSHDLDVADHIEVCYLATPEVKAAVEAQEQFIKDEVIADELKALDNMDGEIFDLNGQETRIEIKKN